MAREIDTKAVVLINTIAIGFILSYYDLPLKLYIDTLKKRFSNKQILDNNITALDKGINEFSKSGLKKYNISDPNINKNYILVSGNEMIGLGAAASGLKFLAQYPITPASSILTYLSKMANKFKIIVRQPEDELAAISMIIGASYAGARVMTASSGPGLSLMAEAFGYASMTELPMVIVNSMRAGPSTGIPTKMEQADLNFMIHLSHGESPKLIIAPRTISECYELTVKAFNYADIYQLPVIILSDFALSEGTANIPPVNLEVEINRGKIWTEPTSEFPTFKRHVITDDGISPRVIPPTPNAMYIAVGAEHDESAHSLSGNRCGLPESGIIREKMFKKRYRKMDVLKKELEGPIEYGKKNAEFTIICWGSTFGAIKEVVDYLNKKEESWNLLSFAYIFPLPTEKIRPYLDKIKYGIVYEVNYTGQFEMLLHNYLDWKADDHIHPLSGENPTPKRIISEIKELQKRRK